ncbi:hypothetical protein L210DRAFT_3387890 [Boletus edulis BED1]|uniref:RhoGAP-domain-containing protein n=1 Tax=Boletus edulis BED1 TaxID=1328754 RepID=A0AAD4C5Q3_BOLED|nr:hypothetical protein L210DRAFT_3387890 [Boletus edulis BED1]
MSSPPSSYFDGTHIRDRNSSSNSTSSRPHPSSSLPPSATSPTTHPISLDALLAQHASAPNPTLAALDQALSERNIFSTQNTQLWKLIEKQRSGYNHVIKELERMRSERDAYKARLQAAGLSVELAKKDKDKPKSLRPSVSNTAMSTTSENGFLDPRATMVRHVSDTSRLSFPSLQSHAPPIRSTPVPSTHPTSFIPPSSSSLSSGLLSPIPEDSKSVNRNSDVSLPDETKRYIINMDDSPLQSPGLTAVATIPGPPQTCHGANTGKISPSKLGHVGAYSGDETEFLDMDEEEESEETEQQQPLSAINNDKSADTDDYSTPPSHGPTQLPSAPEPVVASQTHWQSQSDASMLSQSQSSIESTPLTSHPDSPSPESYLSLTKSTHGTSGNGPSPTFRALPLIANDLKTTRVMVSHSSIRPNDRGKEVLSFEIDVHPGNGKESWKVEKLYSDVLGLDHRLRAIVGKGVAKKIATLPEGKFWRDHAPAKSDQRKAALEVYLQSLIDLPVKNKNEVIAFLTSDIVRDAKKPVMQAGHKEGYLTKRGKNFGGWKTRYFVLQGPVLEYYESRGGAHLGSIVITNAQIGRQQRTADNDDEKNYRHAFLIIEAKKVPGGSNSRHVLCAESDPERDSWVNILVRYVTGTFNEDSFPLAQGSIGPNLSVDVSHIYGPGSGQPRSSVSSNQDTAVTTPNGKRGMRVSKDDISRATVMPISQLTQDASNFKFFQAAPLPGSASIDEPYPSPTRSYTKRLVDRVEPTLSSSLPTTSPLEAANQALVAFRSSSELGHYADIDRRVAHSKQEQGRPESGRPREARRDRKSYHLGLAAVSGSPTITTFPDRATSPDPGSLPSRGGDPNGKIKISGPLNGAPIPAGYKFGGKDAPTEGTSSSDRREKAKSRSFWNFGKPADRVPTFVPRAVFGIPLEESLEVAEIARLPAVVFRCIQYLEAKKADQEEGIYRLSGSSAVIKGLKDRFNTDLLASDEYWDPHAIAGLLKSFLRELPASILTRDLHMRFLSVMDFVEPQERIRELSHLIALLPIANYSLLRALTAHLILIVQNSPVNKMTMRNVGIVFSPTLGIPAGVFSLMLGEFNRVFNVDAANDITEDDADQDGELSRRNSRQYSDAAADKLLGLSGRTLHASTEETPSEDSDNLSTQYESGNETTENDATVESSQTRSSNPSQYSELTFPAVQSQSQSHASHVAASLGLEIAVTKRGNRHSRVMGLPISPRPPTDAIPSASPLPLQTARQS